jgi:hypothetical protein
MYLFTYPSSLFLSVSVGALSIIKSIAFAPFAPSAFFFLFENSMYVYVMFIAKSAAYSNMDNPIQISGGFSPLITL